MAFHGSGTFTLEIQFMMMMTMSYMRTLYPHPPLYIYFKAVFLCKYGGFLFFSFLFLMFHALSRALLAWTDSYGPPFSLFLFF